MKQYEYLVEEFDPEVSVWNTRGQIRQTQEHLNKRGGDGWELTAVEHNGRWLYFKRKRREFDSGRSP